MENPNDQQLEPGKQYQQPPYPYQQNPPIFQQQQQQVVIIENQPTAALRPGQPQNIREWSSGICGCCEDCSSCCYAYCCYCCFLCTLAERMNECYCGPYCCGGYIGMQPPGLSSINGNTCLPIGPPNTFLIALRSKLRAQHGIKGSVCKDIMCIWCCEFCATTQMYRELKHLG